MKRQHSETGVALQRASAAKSPQIRQVRQFLNIS
jgi:hypothetical protein